MQVNVKMDLDEAIRYIGGLIEDKYEDEANKIIDSVCLDVNNAVAKADNIVKQRDALLLQVEANEREIRRLKEKIVEYEDFDPEGEDG